MNHGLAPGRRGLDALARAHIAANRIRPHGMPRKSADLMAASLEFGDEIGAENTGPTSDEDGRHVLRTLSAAFGGRPFSEWSTCELRSPPPSSYARS